MMLLMKRTKALLIGIASTYTEEWVDFDWLVDATEKWCQERAIYNALMESIKIIKMEAIRRYQRMR